MTALDGVSLLIDEAAFVVTLGPSGRGKMPLLNTIGAPDTQTTGTIQVDEPWTDPRTDAASALFGVTIDRQQRRGSTKGAGSEAEMRQTDTAERGLLPARPAVQPRSWSRRRIAGSAALPMLVVGGGSLGWSESTDGFEYPDVTRLDAAPLLEPESELAIPASTLPPL